MRNAVVVASLIGLGVVPPIFRSTTTVAPEMTIIPVKPGAMYWVTVGAKLGSTGLPAAYSATLCPTTYTPASTI